MRGVWHFAEFAKVFEENAVAYELHADYKNLDELAAISDQFSAVIVDIAPQSEEVLELFQTLGKKTYVYYDNPEEFVPGGYSETANKIRAIADRTLFANANLATGEKDIGIGYSPVVNDVLEIRKMRETSDRTAFLKKHEIEDTGQKIIVYFEGANETHYTQAFPHFLDLLKEWDFSNTVLVFQQHPRALKEGNRDGGNFKEKNAPNCFFKGKQQRSSSCCRCCSLLSNKYESPFLFEWSPHFPGWS